MMDKEKIIKYSKDVVKFIKKQDETKKIVLAWDPEYTKLTKKEKELLDKAEKEYENGDIVEDSEEI